MLSKYCMYIYGRVSFKIIMGGGGIIQCIVERAGTFMHICDILDIYKTHACTVRIEVHAGMYYGVQIYIYIYIYIYNM